ncbi:hypothetical protein [Natronorarus salvus]|uniref:hypothetical protein n=1 Tax=Natronorarus salvus TaxID=3117733 RepID=UPI002F26AA22
MSRPELPRSVETIDEQLEALTDRIEALEAENTALKAEHRALARALEANTSPDSNPATDATGSNATSIPDVLELRGADSPEDARLDQIWIAGHPIGLMLTRRRSEIEALSEVLDDLRLDGGSNALPIDQLLPIQETARDYEVDPSLLTANKRRAALIWTTFFETCERTPTKFVLDSGAVKTILRVNDESHHNETVRRVMELVSELGEDLISCETHRNTKRLMIDRAEFEAFVDRLGESSSRKRTETTETTR